jgi:hypothetical protein
MSHKKGEGYSYWPGYVDALTNIVLNLLFLVAIFVIGVAALGLVASQRKEVPVGAVVSAAPQTVVDRIKDVVRKIIVSSPATLGAGSVQDANQKNKPSVIVEKINKQSDVTVIRLAFAQDAYLIGKAEEVEVMRQLSTALQTIGKKIVIWAASQPDDALSVRGNMTRLLSIRNMLLHHGVAGELIEVRILSQAPQTKAAGHVFIEINKEDGYVENK